ncbi:MAG: flagellar basal body rod protein FlgB [Mariprofundaceae bacterium]
MSDGISLFTSRFRSIESAAVAREHMQQGIAANIANGDTPNYIADRRTFEDHLTNVRQPDGNGMARTNSRHLSASASYSTMDRPFSKENAVQRMDGNTVDLMKEMAAMSENQMMHELSLKLLKGKLSGLRNTIKEVSR